jgi:hypothetical protein
MKSFNEYITEAKAAPSAVPEVTPKLIAKVAAMKPMTICDLLKQGKPDTLKRTMSGSFWEESVARILKVTKLTGSVLHKFKKPKWVSEIEGYGSALRQWYERQGGNKADIIPLIMQMAACKNRAKWAKWSGKAWRGFRRNPAQIKGAYEFTDKIAKLSSGSDPCIVAKVKYRSKYPIQSWSSSMKVAEAFAVNDNADEVGTIGVMIQADITEKEGFLSPKASEFLNDGMHDEDEVLRIGNEAKEMPAYIIISTLVDTLVTVGNGLVDRKTEAKIEDQSIPNAKRIELYIKAATPKVASLIGKDNAQIVMNPKHLVCKLLLHYMRLA